MDYSKMYGVGGVYYLRNNSNGKEYIGFSIRISDRIRDGHLAKLKKNIHHNEYLQKDWNLNPEEWDCGIIEITSNKERERFWINERNSLVEKGGYNIDLGTTHSESHIQKLSKSLKGRSSWNTGITTNILPWNAGKVMPKEYRLMHSLSKKIKYETEQLIMYLEQKNYIRSRQIANRIKDYKDELIIVKRRWKDERLSKTISTK